MNRERRNEPTITVAPHTLYSTFIFPIQKYCNTYDLEENPGTKLFRALTASVSCLLLSLTIGRVEQYRPFYTQWQEVWA
jgi:hypothetical protein